MKDNKITIRLETKNDYRETENLTREAFWNVYRPGCMEHYVLHCYRRDPAFVPELDFVMELDGELIGQVIYVRSEIVCDDGRKVPIMTFGPIGIAPDYKRKGYGKRLLDYSMEKAKEMGCELIIASDYIKGSLSEADASDFEPDRRFIFITKSKAGDQYLDSFGGVYSNKKYDSHRENVFVKATCYCKQRE